MADYTQTTDFSAKDSLSTGDPEKIILGADFDAEFDAISTAIASKYDSTDLANQSQAEAATSNSVLMTPLRLDNWAADNAGMVKDIQALADPGADTLLGWDDSASAAINYTVGDGLTITGTTIEADVGVVDAKYKTSGTTRASTTTIADDPDLSGWTIEQDVDYILEGLLIASCASAGVDFDVAWALSTGTGSPIMRLHYHSTDGSGNVESFFEAAYTSQVTFDIAASSTIAINVVGYVAGPSSGGSQTLDLQWAQNVSNANGVTLGEGSWIRLTKLS